MYIFFLSATVHRSGSNGEAMSGRPPESKAHQWYRSPWLPSLFSCSFQIRKHHGKKTIIFPSPPNHFIFLVRPLKLNKGLNMLAPACLS